MKDDRIPKRKEHDYIIKDEAGFHLESEMECCCEEFTIGDRVVVTTEYDLKRENYPWLPDLAGMDGIVTDLITHTPVTNEPLDGPIYIVTFETPFKRGEVDADELLKTGMTKEEWLTELTVWHFCYLGNELCRI